MATGHQTLAGRVRMQVIPELEDIEQVFSRGKANLVHPHTQVFAHAAKLVERWD